METHQTDYGTIYLCDNKQILPLFEENSIDAMVTDPPYGYGMKDSAWDCEIPTVDFWKEALRVLKPGAFALVASGTRVQHRMATNLENAGFEIRDVIAWVYKSGFSKDSDCGKIAGSEWEGFKPRLKPAMELWTLAKKPIGKNTLKENLKEYGTGALNFNKCRIKNDYIKPMQKKYKQHREYSASYRFGKKPNKDGYIVYESHPDGREPSNFIHDGSDEVIKLFTDGAQHFFYCPKASQSERNLGVEGRNDHSTVKPLLLCRYLVRLITPPNGIVLDPFLGSGTTALACIEERLKYIGIEQDAHYFEIAKQRIEYSLTQLTIF